MALIGDGCVSLPPSTHAVFVVIVSTQAQHDSQLSQQQQKLGIEPFGNLKA
jgi:hypothetical protein